MTGRRTREEVSDLAGYWTDPAHEEQVEDMVVWEALATLAGADLEWKEQGYLLGEDALIPLLQALRNQPPDSGEGSGPPG